MIVLDTSILIEIVKGGEKANRIREKLAQEALGTSSFTMHEFLLLARPNEQEIFRELIESMKIFPFDESCVEHSVQIEQALKVKGNIIGKIDIFIAAICKAQNAAIFTLDKDFNRISGLKVISV